MTFYRLFTVIITTLLAIITHSHITGCLRDIFMAFWPDWLGVIPLHYLPSMVGYKTGYFLPFVCILSLFINHLSLFSARFL